MKKLLLTLTSVLFCAITLAQSVPQGINYQAVARDANGDVLMNQALTIQFSVISDITTSAVSWQETHQDTTNAYGLFTAIIGVGTTTSVGSSVTFDVIDWGASNHLLKVEVNYGGGLVDMGTTAFMSVPYSIYSANPGPQGLQGVPGNDGQDGQDGTNGVDGVDGQGGITNAGTGISVTGAGTSVSPYVVSTSTCGLSIGDTTQGGIIFYLDPSGCHGLVCALTDQSSGTAWYNGSYMDTRAYGSGLFEGKYNTKMINWEQGGSTSAAAICAAYTGGFFNDWYLPSNEELNKMYLNIGQGNALGLGNIGGFASNYYWSSTEFDDGLAWKQSFLNGNQFNYPKSSNYFVRAVRAF